MTEIIQGEQDNSESPRRFRVDEKSQSGRDVSGWTTELTVTGTFRHGRHADGNSPLQNDDTFLLAQKWLSSAVADVALLRMKSEKLFQVCSWSGEANMALPFMCT